MIVIQESQIAFAVNNEDLLETVEYSEEYLKWLELSDEEKENTIAPRMYDIQNTNKDINVDRSYNNVLSYTEQQMLSLVQSKQVYSQDNFSFISFFYFFICYCFFVVIFL